jgi:hypothetical protein
MHEWLLVHYQTHVTKLRIHLRILTKGWMLLAYGCKYSDNLLSRKPWNGTAKIGCGNTYQRGSKHWPVTFAITSAMGKSQIKSPWLNPNLWYQRFKSSVSNLKSNHKSFGLFSNLLLQIKSNQITNLQEKIKWWSSYLLIINTRSKRAISI